MRVNTSGLKTFFSGDFIWIVAGVAVIFIMGAWKKADFVKVGSTMFFFLIISDFALKKGETIMKVLKWFFKLFGINF